VVAPLQGQGRDPCFAGAVQPDPIAAITGISPGGQRILVGFLPECLDLNNGDTILRDLPIQSGNMLIVEEDQTRPKPSPAFPKHGTPSYVRETLPVLTRTSVPADNSCLFTSVYYVVEGGVLNPACAPEMRRLIAQIVASDPDFYSEALLGKTNQEYCDWIKRDDTWGGEQLKYRFCLIFINVKYV
jgi:ubiquitin thioesterase OTU1